MGKALWAQAYSSGTDTGPSHPPAAPRPEPLAPRFPRPLGSDPLAPPRVHLSSQRGASDVRRPGSRAFLLPGRSPPSSLAALRAHSDPLRPGSASRALAIYSQPLGKTLLPYPTPSSPPRPPPVQCRWEKTSLALGIKGENRGTAHLKLSGDTERQQEPSGNSVTVP